MKISHIVIPAAGWGTRFLSITKTVPKGLLPLMNKPALQAIVEEGFASNIKKFFIVVGDDNSIIKDYFSRNKKLEAALEQNNKTELIKDIRKLIDACQFQYITQPHMLGLGHAILMAKDTIQDDYFGVMLPDDIIVAEKPCMEQLQDIAQQEQATVIAVMEMPPEEISAYGCIKPGKQFQEDVVEVVDIIEKPKPQEAFSNLAIIGRYILPSAIFQAIEAIAPQAHGEIQLTDALTYLAQNGHKVVAYKIKGKRFDIGRPPGWLAANLYIGMQSPEYGAQIKQIIEELRNNMK